MQLQFENLLVAEKRKERFFRAPHHPVKHVKGKLEYIKVVVHFKSLIKRLDTEKMGVMKVDDF